MWTGWLCFGALSCSTPVRGRFRPAAGLAMAQRRPLGWRYCYTPSLAETRALPGRVWFRQLPGGQMNAARSRRTGLCIRTGLPPAHSGRMVNTYQSVVSPPASVALTRTVWLAALGVSMRADEPFMYAR